MQNRFKNKVAVITGAAQGIGKRVAERMAEEEGTLLLIDRAEIVHDVAAALNGKNNVISLTADLEKFSECQRVMDAAIAHFGRIDILVTTSAARSGPSPSSTTQKTRSRPKYAARSSQPCGAAERLSPTCSRTEKARSLTSRQ